MNKLRTWVEIDKNALCHNAEQFLKLIPKETKLMAMVKSNAYWHGLWQVAEILSAMPSFKKRGWFGVDSLVEGLRLRREKIKNPILVLGFTLPRRINEAAQENIAVTISNFESLATLVKLKVRPKIHLKIDTGMHRQGFLPQDTQQLINILKSRRIAVQGTFTHLAQAENTTFTKNQLKIFKKICGEFEQAGFVKLIRHASASGGAILHPESHLDMARIGMSLYGYFPSSAAAEKSRLSLHPVLTWRTIIGEIKEIPAGSYVGYDRTEQVKRKTKIAVLPIGYWHGYDRGLSGISEVLIKGKRAKLLGRVSMDMMVADITKIQGAKVGDYATLIGKDKKESIWADELSRKIGTTPYEFLTRINPLIRRIIR